MAQAHDAWQHWWEAEGKEAPVYRLLNAPRLDALAPQWVTM